MTVQDLAFANYCRLEAALGWKGAKLFDVANEQDSFELAGIARFRRCSAEGTKRRLRSRDPFPLRRERRLVW